MKKNSILFLTLVVFISNLTILAQQSTATWQQTVDWLESNITMLDTDVTSYSKSKSTEKTSHLSYLILDGKIIYKINSDVSYKIPLDKIVKVEMVHKPAHETKYYKYDASDIISLECNSKVITWLSEGEILGYDNGAGLNCPSEKDNVSRVLKALEHIVYLNKERIESEPF